MFDIVEIINLSLYIIGTNWFIIVVATVAGYAVGIIWYGFLFRKQLIRLTDRQKGEKVSKQTMFVGLLASFALAYFITFLMMLDDVVMSWIILGSFVDVLLLGILASTMLEGRNDMRAFKMWFIHIGYYLVKISIVVGVVLLGIEHVLV